MDYLKEWQQQFDAACACDKHKTDYYDQLEHAAGYDASVTLWEDGQRRAASFDVSPDETVLDIGPGPGILALPLARRVRQVTAVEPARGMRLLLHRHMEEQGIRNIRVIPQGWLEADPEEIGLHDVVIDSYTFNMRDIGPALLKMNALAKKRVILYWCAGLASWEKLKADLLPRTSGRPFASQPKADLLYGALVQLGFSPSVTPLEGTVFCYDYPSLEAAVQGLQMRLDLAPGSFEDLLTDYIRREFIPLPGGLWRFEDTSRYVRMEWTPTVPARP